MPFRISVSAILLCLVLASPVRAALADELGEVNRLHRAGQSQAALERADKYLAAQPRDAQMRFLKSVLLAEADRKPEAITMLEQLVQDYPELAEPHNNLAALYASSGAYDKARGELQESLRLNPRYAVAFENLGDIQVLLAAQAYEQALRLEPASASLPGKLRIVRQIGVPIGSDSAASAVGPATRSEPAKESRTRSRKSK